jgi:hypothetical protein
MRPKRVKEPQPTLLRFGVGALVRQDDAVLVRLDAQRGDEPAPGPLDSVRSDVLLLERPEGRVSIPDKRAVREPLAPQPARVGFVLGQGQVDDVERAPGHQLITLRLVDDVVGRSHQLLQRAGYGLVVADGPNRLDHGHEQHRTILLPA